MISTAWQVAHVWKKDWLRTRWSFLLLCAALMLATVMSTPMGRDVTCPTRTHCESTWLYVWYAVTAAYGLFAITFIAGVVQDDSPTDPASFWRSQPVRPLSLLIAKFLYAVGCVLLLAGIAQAFSLKANGVLLSGSGAVLGLTLYWTVSMVLLVMLIAAITRGMQALLLATAALVLLRTVVSKQVLLFFGLPQAIAGSSLRGDVWIAAAITTIVWIYLRPTRVKHLSAAVVSIALVVLTFTWNTGTSKGIRFLSNPVEQPNTTPPRITYTITERDSSFDIRLEAPAPVEGHRYSLRCGAFILRFANGLFWGSWQAACYSGRMGQPTFTRDTTSAHSSTVSYVTRIPKFGPTLQYAAILATSWLFEAFLEEEASQVIGDIGVEAGATLEHDGVRFRTRVTDTDSAGRTFRNVSVNVVEAQEPVFYVRQDEAANQLAKSIALVPNGVIKLSESAFEFQVIVGTGTVSSPSPTVGANERWTTSYLVLPAPDIRNTFTGVKASCQPTCAPEWWNGKRITITRWKHVSYVPLHAHGLMKTQRITP